MSFNPSDFWLADGGSRSLSNAVIARTGSGKTVWATQTLVPSLKRKSALGTRIIYISPKLEDPFTEVKSIKTAQTTDIAKIPKLLQKNQVITYYPMNPETYDYDVDDIIEMVFALKDANPYITIKDKDGKKTLIETQYHIIFDDAQIINGFSNRKDPSSAVKKLVIGGRSKNLKGTFIVHRVNALPRIMSGNLGQVIMLSSSGIDADNMKRILGFEMDDVGTLTDYRWVHIDLLSDTLTKYSAVSIEAL